MRLLAWPLLLPCARAIGGSFFRENTVEARSEPLIPRTGDGYTSVGYGVDVSFPMHHYPDPKSWGGVMYDDFMQGCAADYRMSSCKSNEESRMAMNRDQIPRQRNFTELGFAKIKAPQAVYGAARRFWDLHRDSTTSEQWPAGNTYVNHWKADSQMCSFEDRRFQPLGLRTKDTIWDAARPVLEAWVGEKLKPTSLYGIRVYYEDAILATHVDRLPLVTSAIINVDQDVDEPWPIEVVGHDGVAYNVTLEPGDMALYESHTVLHGRPFPLKGKFFANAFVHFIPVDPNDNSQNHPDIDFGWTAKARQERRDPKVFAEAQRRLEAMPKPPPHAVSVARARAAALKVDADRGEARPAPPEEPRREVAGSKSKPAAPGRRGRLRVEPRMPPKAAPKAEPGHQVHAGEDFGKDSFTTGTHSLHEAAADGDLKTVQAELERDPDAVNAPDENLWTPLHEAARGGDLATVEYLVEHGADLGSQTVTGGSALHIARLFKHARVSAFLDTLGAPDIADQEL